MKVRVFIASPDEMVDATRSSVPLEDAFEDIETNFRLNPDSPMGVLILPSHVNKDDVKEIIDVLKEHFK